MTTLTKTAPTEAPERYSAFIRCDRCQSQAYATSTKDDHILMWCLHHVKAHKDVLDSSGWLTTLDAVGIEADLGITE